MTNPTSLLVQTLTAATLSYPAPHVDICMGFLCRTLDAAGFEHAAVSDNPAFGIAVECDRFEHHHVVLALILSPDAYEMTQDDISDFAHAILDADEHLDDLKRELGDSVLDVASVCLDPVQARCRIHHPQDILETCQLHEQPVHFFIPAGGDTPVPAEDWDDKTMGSPFALGHILATA